MYAVKIRCLHRLVEIAALRPKINALNLASARPDPFSTFEFYENLLRHEGSLTGGTRSRVWFLAAFIDRELIGYLALEEVTETVLWRRIKRLGFLVAHDADRPHVVAKAEHLGIVTEMFYEYLREHRREWDLLELQQQDAASTLYPLPPGVQLKGCWVRCWPNLDNGTIRVRWNTLQEYFEALAPKFRANLLRQLRKLLGSVSAKVAAEAFCTVTVVRPNLIAEAEKPTSVKLLYLLLVLVPTIGLTLYTVARSKVLSDFLEALSDERLSASQKFRALLAIWRRPRREPPQTP